MDEETAEDEETADGYSTPSLHGRPADSAGTDPVPQADRPSRRGVLVAGAVFVAAAAGVGVAVGRAGHTSTPKPLTAVVPADLAAALSAEQVLLAGVNAALSTAHGKNRAALRLIRADHAAHLAALQSAVATAVYPAVPSMSPSASAGQSAPVQSASVGRSASVSRSSPAPSGAAATPPSRTQLRAAERRASARAATRALAATGPNAVLLASIAASEATHAELLS